MMDSGEELTVTSLFYELSCITARFDAEKHHMLNLSSDTVMDWREQAEAIAVHLDKFFRFHEAHHEAE